MYPIKKKKKKETIYRKNFYKKGSAKLFFQLYPYIFFDELFNYKYII